MYSYNMTFERTLHLGKIAGSLFLFGPRNDWENVFAASITTRAVSSICWFRKRTFLFPVPVIFGKIAGFR